MKPAALRAGAAALLTSLLCLPAQAQIPGPGLDDFRAPPDARWGPITQKDVEAAFVLLRDNHPGAAPSLHDQDFQRRLGEAHAQALARARSVTSYPGYTATLAGFAVAMGDKHIWSRPTLGVELLRWPGIVVSKRGGSWLVSDASEGHQQLIGATLIACDGIPVDEFARRSLGTFRVDWNIGAQQIQAAPYLLVDDGNPFVKPATRCELQQDGKRTPLALSWERIKRDNLVPRLKKAAGSGAAGFGLRRVGAGYWIALQDLATPESDQVVKSVEAQQAALREAPFVVLDLRGNGGGSSYLGRQIANALMGTAHVDAVLGAFADDGCEAPWRASPGNIAELAYLVQMMRLAGGPDVQQRLQEKLDQSRSAHERDEEFSGPITCKSAAAGKSAAAVAPSTLKGRLIILTDNRCFSSCLLVVEDLRKLGAAQAGQTTDAATHFIEVREEYLPSGYSMFSTLQALAIDSPPQEGPFEPQIPYDGDIADTAKLEAWVVSTVGAATGH